MNRFQSKVHSLLLRVYALYKMKVFRISSKLYFALFQKGGDKLISVYSILKTSREGKSHYLSYKSKNNKTVSGYALLRSQTNLSLNTIKKYVPILIDMGLCSIDSDGNVLLLGNRKTKEIYGNKLVPIQIGINLTKTAYNCMIVRLKSAEKQQLHQISVKNHRSELLRQGKNPKNLKQYQQAKKLIKKLGTSKIEVNSNVVLSLQGYATLKDGTKDNKSKGSYWKKIMKNNCGLKTKRVFTKVAKMSKDEYSFLKSSNILEKNAVFSSQTSSLYLESISSFFFLKM